MRGTEIRVCTYFVSRFSNLSGEFQAEISPFPVCRISPSFLQIQLGFLKKHPQFPFWGNDQCHAMNLLERAVYNKLVRDFKKHCGISTDGPPKLEYLEKEFKIPIQVSRQLVGGQAPHKQFPKDDTVMLITECLYGRRLTKNELLAWFLRSNRPTNQRSYELNPDLGPIISYPGDPSLPSPFLGRESALDTIRTLLTGDLLPRDEKEALHKVTKIGIHGEPGIGKSAFSVYLANDILIRALFRGGILWALVDQDAPFGAIYGRWLSGLAIREFGSTVSLNKQREELQNFFRKHPTLIIADDVWTRRDLNELYTLVAGTCSLVVTSRIRDIAVEATDNAAHEYHLRGLEPSDSLKLLEELAPDAFKKDGDKGRCLQLVMSFGNNPLAIQLVGKILRKERERDVGTLIDEIMDQGRIIQADPPPSMVQLLSQTNPSIASLIKKSIDFLNPDLQERFFSLGSFAAMPAVFKLEAVFDAWRTMDEMKEAVGYPANGLLIKTEEDAKRVLSALEGMGIVMALSQDLYQVHALIAAYARSLRQ